MSVFDVVILGTGAAGLTAAIAAHEAGARVGVFEKADLLGGTSAWSGGQLWIPNNPHMSEVGVADSRANALTYILSLSHDMIQPALAEAFLDGGPEMVRFLESCTPVQLHAVADFPDYHPEFPGGSKHGGRTLECSIFPFDELGAWASRITPSPYYPVPYITMSETPLGKAVPTPPSSTEIERRRTRNERGCGQALIGRLLKGCLDRGIEPRTSWRAVELIMDNSEVTGVRFETPKGRQEIAARRGVVLATGGFEWNPEYVRTFLRGPMTHPVSVKTNTGDGLHMVMKIGAMLGNMREAWWTPVAELPPNINSMNQVMINGHRTRPGSIMVNRQGKRFTNEAANYNAFGAAFHAMDVPTFSYANLPCWLIFDHGYINRYGFDFWPQPGVAPEWLTRAPTVRALAERLGMPGDALEKTVNRWNECARNGSDPDFHRGESAFDTWWGDPDMKGQRAGTLGPLAEGPFYAIAVHSGSLGTKGGPRTDCKARVLDLDAKPIPGLYAAGNVMASPFGMTYCGPGGTLGPAMVFGFLAGRDAAERRAVEGRLRSAG